MYQKLLPEENSKNLLDCKISRFLKFSTLLFMKVEFFPIKNHLVFSTIERHVKISDKNIVPPGGAQIPEGGSILPLF